MTHASPGSGLSDERLEILRLVESQIISADEAARILEALDRSDQFRPGNPPITPHTSPSPPPPPPAREAGSVQPGSVRIRITEVDSSKAKVNLVLPYRLVDAGVKMAKRLAPDQMGVLDSKEIRRSIRDGFWGPLVDITDDTQRIEIIVEGGIPAHDEEFDDGTETRKIT